MRAQKETLVKNTVEQWLDTFSKYSGNQIVGDWFCNPKKSPLCKRNEAKQSHEEWANHTRESCHSATIWVAYEFC